MSSNKEVEGIIKELLTLAKRKPLKGEDLSRAKKLMGELREMDFTNKQISGLTNGRWSEPTVKRYTRGVGVKDSSQKQEALKLLTQLVSMGLTLRDVETSVSIREDLDAKGVSFQDVSSFLEEAKTSKMSPKELVEMYRNVKDSKLSVSQLSEALSYRSDLMEAGFSILDISDAYEMAKKFGKPIEVLKAIDRYGYLKAIEREIEQFSNKKIELESRVKELEKLRLELEGTIEACTSSTGELLKTLTKRTEESVSESMHARVSA